MDIGTRQGKGAASGEGEKSEHDREGYTSRTDAYCGKHAARPASCGKNPLVISLVPPKLGAEFFHGRGEVRPRFLFRSLPWPTDENPATGASAEPDPA